MIAGARKATPASAYVCHYPCLQTAQTTQFNYGGSAGLMTLVSGADPDWYYLGCPVKFRTPSGSPGIVIDTLYYMRRVTLGSYQLHASLAGALANTDLAPLTSNGGGTNYIYPAFLVDVTGLGNHGEFNTKATDQNMFATAGYVGSSSESGTQAQNVLIAPSQIGPAATTQRWDPAAGQSLFLAVRINGTGSANKRCVFGNGGIGASQAGFSVYSDASSTTRARIGVSTSDLTITSTLSGATVFDSTERSVALGLDCTNNVARLWVDGVEDTQMALTILPSNSRAIRLGGFNNDAIAAVFRHLHVLAFPGALPASIGNVAAMLHQHRLRTLLDSHLV